MTVRRFGSGLLSTGQLLSIVALAIAGGLLVWAVLPMALGMSTHAVVSGSMTPQVDVGDVLVSREIGPDSLKPGMVVLFKDPSRPERVVSHRIKEIHDDGSLTTQGDANPSVDPVPVPVGNVLGVAALRIPWIGYPAVWFGNGNYGLVLLTLIGLTTATSLAAWPDPKPVGPPPGEEPWPWLVHLRTPV
ncbi:signal peptidase I [Kineosporia sp. NBRC 101731]|uniref:signal peptidase I n=1 Tax=Kineosporia sp. NBRC 101731 TaxID=3032199 RepID=UPI0024A5B4FD|nr:signal peptidase I [Kineosporia sp. NBRC 101731]GLY28750.1 hypothetical protein Kisp02_21150 [Kineosporia sp. NBRC 101731]